MSLPFLTALRRQEHPASVCVEREFTVTYSNGACACGNCTKQKQVRALNRRDARDQFQRQFPLAWVLSVG
jgi:hypothetical protein